MLSGVLSRETCSRCRFCCSFRRQSLWETPLFTDEAVKKLSAPNEYGVISEFKDRRTVLSDKYKTSDSEEEVLCPFLDRKRGCVLSAEDKPFDCSIWPLRIMDKNGELVIALTPTCPALGEKPSDELKKLVIKDGLGRRIHEYAKEHPYIVKPYKEGFPVIMILNKA